MLKQGGGPTLQAYQHCGLQNTQSGANTVIYLIQRMPKKILILTFTRFSGEGPIFSMYARKDWAS